MPKTFNQGSDAELDPKTLITQIGNKATDDAKTYAIKLKMNGDKEGYDTWMRVAEHIQEVESSILKNCNTLFSPMLKN